MAKPKIRISAKEVVEDIRSGADDLMLMNKYGLSLRNLRKLFDRLVSSENIEQAEIDRRVFDPALSHAVDLVPAKEPDGVRAVVKTIDAVNAIRSGMSDAALMEQFGLSARGLASLFGKLAAAGDLDATELEHRRLSVEWAELAFMGELPEEEESDGEETSRPTADPAVAAPARFLEKHKTWLAALGGAVAGMLAASVLFVTVYGIEWPGRGRPAARSALEATVLALQRQAEDLIRIVEGIVTEASGTGRSPAPQTAPYEECMKRCDRTFSGSDDVIAVGRLNCKKECLAKYSERIRKLRSRYYGK